MSSLPTTLTPIIDGYSEDVTKRIFRSQFGDGYSQRILNGINPIVRNITLKFTGDIATILTYRDFFRDVGGDSFDWTPPTESTSKKWTCEQWSLSFINQTATLHASLREEFDL